MGLRIACFRALQPPASSNTRSFVRRWSPRAAQEQVTQDENVHVCPEEAVQCFGRCPHNRLVFVERSIEHHGNAGYAMEFADKRVVQWVSGSVNGLETS